MIGFKEKEKDQYSREEFLEIIDRLKLGLLSEEEKNKFQINLVRIAVNEVKPGDVDIDFQDAAYFYERRCKDLGVDTLPGLDKESIWLDKAIEKRSERLKKLNNY